MPWTIQDLLPGQEVSTFERGQAEWVVNLYPVLAGKINGFQVEKPFSDRVQASLRGSYANGWDVVLNRFLFDDPNPATNFHGYTPTHTLRTSVAHELAHALDNREGSINGFVSLSGEKLFSFFDKASLRHYAKINSRDWRNETTAMREGFAEIFEDAVLAPGRFIKRTLSDKDLRSFLDVWKYLMNEPFPAHKDWQMGEKGFFAYTQVSGFFEEQLNVWARTPLGIMSLQGWDRFFYWHPTELKWYGFAPGISWFPRAGEPIPENVVCYREINGFQIPL
jgi:hypothetical protein